MKSHKNVSFPLFLPLLPVEPIRRRRCLLRIAEASPKAPSVAWCRPWASAMGSSTWRCLCCRPSCSASCTCWASRAIDRRGSRPCTSPGRGRTWEAPSRRKYHVRAIFLLPKKRERKGRKSSRHYEHWLRFVCVCVQMSVLVVQGGINHSCSWHRLSHGWSTKEDDKKDRINEYTFVCIIHSSCVCIRVYTPLIDPSDPSAKKARPSNL